ncbi:hypothetical protein QYE76_042722 [Lolium multiflorum]|uniref:DUF4219 domain-containing protein n=1 Tax=Lolium multiflorum TaxID=4521 RepID=A0AAD8WVE2_LOLMU|nr:hypothetical protein QYE76_042722 [Lolium multiflorum]
MSSGDEDDKKKKAAEASGTPKAQITPLPMARLTADGGDMVVVERVIRESDGGGHVPPLTRTNYVEWALLMKVQLQVAGVWDVVVTGVGDPRDDRRAIAAILRGVPPELLRTLAVKDTAKAAWDTLKTMRLGTERVREAKTQTR